MAGRRPARSRRPLGCALAVGALVSLALTAPPSAGAVAAHAAPAGAGPFRAGVTTLELSSGALEVWYPVPPAATAGHRRATYDIADWLPPALAARVPAGLATFRTDAYRDVPAAPGSFPLVLFAHGLYSFRDQSTFLTAWLATWGYVVAAPELTSHDLTEYFEHPGAPPPLQPTDYDVLAEAEQRLMTNGGPGAPSGLTVRPGAVAVIGHSLGGLDAIEFAARPEVALYVDMAGANGQIPPDLPAKASLYLTGSADHDVRPAWVRALYRAAPGPKRLVVLPRAGHLAFTDLCLVGRGRGGLPALGAALGLHLPAGAPFTGRAVDGCGPDNLAPGPGFSVIRPAVLAALRSALGPVGSGPAVPAGGGPAA